MATREPFRRTFLGEDSWIEIFQRAATIAALAFGFYAYVHSVKPVFEKESELQAHRERVQQFRAVTRQLENDRSTLQQRVEGLQALAAANDEGLVFWHLAEIRDFVVREARLQQQAGAAFDLRDFSLAYASAVLDRSEPATPGSSAGHQRKAVEFFRLFVERTIPPGQSDARRLGPLLDAYDRQVRD
ncbi:MAG TPA: hypothetical protein VF121_01445 [Thermoanaerobaculia bacterium]|nr:hypothetical protein [Thermoanaerobaculia bacterium]